MSHNVDDASKIRAFAAAMAKKVVETEHACSASGTDFQTVLAEKTCPMLFMAGSVFAMDMIRQVTVPALTFALEKRGLPSETVTEVLDTVLELSSGTERLITDLFAALNPDPVPTPIDPTKIQIAE